MAAQRSQDAGSKLRSGGKRRYVLKAERVGRGRGGAAIGRLCEGEPRLVVDLEHLLDGVDVRRRPQVQAQVVLARRAHDLLKTTGSDVVTGSRSEGSHAHCGCV